MNELLDQLGLHIPSLLEAARLVLELLVAALIGGVLGYERERSGKEAGVRTHVLVSMGSALFVLAAKHTDVPPAELTRVIQGVCAGVGFLGAGVILKISEQEKVIGLTTAATIWLTAALGVTVGMGNLWLPVVGTLFGLFVLQVVNKFDFSKRSSTNN